MYALTDEFPIEGARSFRRINASEVFGDARIAPDCHAKPTLLPKQKLQQSFGVAMVERNVGAFMRQCQGAIDRNRTIAAFESNREILTASAFADFGLVGAVPENCRGEVGIENVPEFHSSVY